MVEKSKTDFMESSDEESSKESRESTAQAHMKKYIYISCGAPLPYSSQLQCSALRVSYFEAASLYL